MSLDNANDNNPTTDLADRTILVHHTDQPGALIIGALDGAIRQDPNERPDWSDGLSTALLGERHEFYTARLGDLYTDEHKYPEALNFADLGWLTVEADDVGGTLIMDADPEFRMNVVAEVTGVVRSDDLSQGIQGEDHVDGKGTVMAEIEHDMTPLRTDDEVVAFEKSQEYYKERQTGTK